MPERSGERPIRWSPEKHEVNVARRIEGGPEYRLELDPEYNGTLMLFLHGVTEQASLVMEEAGRTEIFFLPNGDCFLYLWWGQFEIEYNPLIAKLGRHVSSMEAYPISRHESHH